MQSMRQVRQVRDFRADVTGNVDGFLDIEVRRVRRAVPERIEHEHAYAAERGAYDVRHQLRIRDIPEPADAEAICAHVAVRHLERYEREAGDVDGVLGIVLAEADVG